MRLAACLALACLLALAAACGGGGDGDRAEPRSLLERSLIVFAPDHGSTELVIWEGGKERRITREEDRNYSRVRLSPDGRFAAVKATIPDSKPSSYVIDVIDLKSGRTTTVVSEIFEHPAGWLPDGSLIVTTGEPVVRLLTPSGDERARVERREEDGFVSVAGGLSPDSGYISIVNGDYIEVLSTSDGSVASIAMSDIVAAGGGNLHPTFYAVDSGSMTLRFSSSRLTAKVESWQGTPQAFEIDRSLDLASLRAVDEQTAQERARAPYATLTALAGPVPDDPKRDTLYSANGAGALHRSRRDSATYIYDPSAGNTEVVEFPGDAPFGDDDQMSFYLAPQ